MPAPAEGPNAGLLSEDDVRDADERHGRRDETHARGLPVVLSRAIHRADESEQTDDKRGENRAPAKTANSIIRCHREHFLLWSVEGRGFTTHKSNLLSSRTLSEGPGWVGFHHP